MRQHVGEDRRFDEEALAKIGAAGAFAASSKLRPLLDCAADRAKHALHVRLGRQRAHFRRGIGGIAKPDCARTRCQPVHDLVSDALMNEEPRASDACLPGGVEDASHGALHRQIQVCVVKNDVRGFTAELENDLLGRLGCDRRDRPPGTYAASEADEFDVGMLRKPAADTRAYAGDDVNDAARKSRLLDQLPEFQDRGRRHL